MTSTNFIPESEAAALAGVSVKTLIRFAEAGYLQTDKGSEGLRLFNRAEIRKTFGIKEQEQPAAVPYDFISPIQPTEQTQAPVNGRERVIDIELPRSEPRPEQTERLRVLEQTLARLEHIIDLQEKILDMREKELNDLKEQRDWLKNRVEKLEDKSTRDQLLLLSHTQTVKRLITINEHRRSPLRLTLEWFGLVKPQESEEQPAPVIERPAARGGPAA